MRVVGDGDDYLVEDRDAAADDVDVTEMNRIEAARIDRGRLAVLSALVQHSGPSRLLRRALEFAGKGRCGDRRGLRR